MYVRHRNVEFLKRYAQAPTAFSNAIAPEEMVPINKETSNIPLHYAIGLMSTTCLVVLLIAIYCTWHCWKVKRKDHSSVNTPDNTPPGYHTTNLKISQSTPNLTEDTASDSKTYRVWSKMVPRQTTLPTVPQRHQSFQRQLSHKLDLSNVKFTVSKLNMRGQPDIGRLKPELYRQSALDERKPSQIFTETCGRLYYSLLYDHCKEQLNVHLIKAEELPAKDFSGTSDPYVKVYLLPDRKNKFQTKVHRKTLCPELDETFNFSVAYNDLTKRMLQFSLYDFDRFSRHDLIGIVLVRDMLNETDLSQETDYCHDVVCTHQEKVDLGELMISLCYLPTAGRLTVTIIKARNLKAMDITGSSDPYVKVSLMCQGKRIRKRKTTVKRNTLNPVYNEALVFDVPAENVEDISLLVKCIDYDRVGYNEFMGCVAIGPHIFGVGRDHWFEMLENPRKPIAQWYPFCEHITGFSSNGTPNGKSKDNSKTNSAAILCI